MTELTPEYQVEKALVPAEERRIEFYGNDIYTVVMDDGRIFVPIKPMSDALGLNWSAQLRRLKRDPVLSEEMEIVSLKTIKSGRGRPENQALPLDFLNGWLFGINASRVKEELREGVIRYQRECYRVLAEHFQIRVSAMDTEGLASLSQVKAMGLAIASLAEEQMVRNRIVDGKFDEVDGKFDGVDGKFDEVTVRLTAVEEQLMPGTSVTEVQATQISQSVKAVAMKMSEKSGRNEYGGVYGELYRKFGITSYKHLPAGRYQEAMDWLTEWYNAIVDDIEF